MFGRNISGKQKAWWGARAIYRGYRDGYLIDLLPDRQGGDGKGDERFFEWLNKRALPWLRNEVQKTSLATDDDKVLSFTEGVFHLEACTNRSYGYLYVGAVQRPGDPGTDPIEKWETEQVCAECDKEKTPRMRDFERVPGRGLCCARCARTHRRREERNRYGNPYRYGW